MVAALFITILASCFLAGLGLRVVGLHWAAAWFLGTLVIPVLLFLTEYWYPNEWFRIALFFSILVSAALAGTGVLVGWLIVRKKKSADAAS